MMKKLFICLAMVIILLPATAYLQAPSTKFGYSRSGNLRFRMGVGVTFNQVDDALSNGMKVAGFNDNAIQSLGVFPFLLVSGERFPVSESNNMTLSLGFDYRIPAGGWVGFTYTGIPSAQVRGYNYMYSETFEFPLWFLTNTEDYGHQVVRQYRQQSLALHYELVLKNVVGLKAGPALFIQNVVSKNYNAPSGSKTHLGIGGIAALHVYLGRFGYFYLQGNFSPSVSFAGLQLNRTDSDGNIHKSRLPPKRISTVSGELGICFSPRFGRQAKELKGL